MKCILCNGNLVPKHGPYTFNSNNLGKVIIPNVEYSECEDCKERFVSSSSQIQSHLKFVEESRIARLPIGEFIDSAEAIQILGITKQAFSKNPKIKRGFIYYRKIGSRYLYHKKSVELFKRNKDGRFMLRSRSTSTWPSLDKMATKIPWLKDGYADSLGNPSTNEELNDSYLLEANG